MNASAEMPKYKCHKEVWALKIEELHSSEDGSAMLVPAERGFAGIRVPPEYVAKHKPEAGGYYVVYSDGYRSFSPAKAFEDGYSPA